MIRYASYSDIGGRNVNEDTVRIRAEENGLCAVLADGLGGYGGGDKASARAAEIICCGWDKDADPETLVKLTELVNREILEMQTPTCAMKTTAVILSCTSRMICYAYIGDSRLYHFAGGALKWQSTDHSASQIAVLLGQIKPEEIRFHEDRSRILRALGQRDSQGADSGIISLENGMNAFLLCSDGFWEYIYEEEMIKTLNESSSPEDWIERMRSYRKDRIPDTCDNNSAIALWIS